MENAPLVVGVASRPLPGETANGDAWAVDWHDRTCRVAIIDGLGHGPEAAFAAERASTVCRQSPGADPVAVLHACHRALHGTRGAAISIASIDTAASAVTLAGVGNVEARVYQQGREQRFSPSRGIVGVILPTIQRLDIPLTGDWLLVLYSDGIRSRFEIPLGSGLVALQPEALATALLADWARAADDATVAVVRPRATVHPAQS